MMLLLCLAALLSATLFAAVALYISLVEHPARLALDDGPLLAQWQPSYKRALPIQAGLAIAGGLSGVAAWYSSAEWQWLVGSIVLLANWPFTLIVIMPVNKRLLTMQRQEAGPESRRMLLQWGRLHDVRSALGTLAMLLFLWAVIAAR